MRVLVCILSVCMCVCVCSLLHIKIAENRLLKKFALMAVLWIQVCLLRIGFYPMTMDECTKTPTAIIHLKSEYQSRSESASQIPNTFRWEHLAKCGMDGVKSSRLSAKLTKVFSLLPLQYIHPDDGKATSEVLWCTLIDLSTVLHTRRTPGALFTISLLQSHPR